MGSIFGGVLGAEDYKHGRDKSDAAEFAAMDYWQNLQPPATSDLSVQLQKAVLGGELTTEQAQTILQQESEMKGIQEDPALRGYQMGGLADLQKIVDSEGLDPQERAKLEQMLSQSATQERGQREAIMANARERGISGSGIELLNNLTAQQGSADRASQAGFDITAEGDARKRQAMQDLLQGSSAVRGQEFTQAGDVAKAQDAINQWNAANKQNVELSKTRDENQANLYNWQRANTVSDKNTDIANQQATFNAGANQQNYQNWLNKTMGATGQLNNISQSGQAQSMAGAKMLGSSLEQADKNLSSAASSFGSDEDNKTSVYDITLADLLKDDEDKDKDKGGGMGGMDMSSIMGMFGGGEGAAGAAGGAEGASAAGAFASDENAKKMMDELHPIEFEYKKGKGPGGKHVGIIAQDLEKSDMGSKAVFEGPDGKMVSGVDSIGPLYAGVADLNARLKKIEGEDA